jgi:hypothetical protein
VVAATAKQSERLHIKRSLIMCRAPDRTVQHRKDDIIKRRHLVMSPLIFRVKFVLKPVELAVFAFEIIY